MGQRIDIHRELPRLGRALTVEPNPLEYMIGYILIFAAILVFGGCFLYAIYRLIKEEIGFRIERRKLRYHNTQMESERMRCPKKPTR